MRGRNKNIKLILNYVVGPLIFCVLLVAIVTQLQQQANWRQSLAQVLKSLNQDAVAPLTAAFVLMFLNWGIEARKWQLALSLQQKISFLHALRAIFSGTTIAFFTPNRVGEYLGRMIHLEEGKRLSSIALTLVCSFAQLMVTLAAGISGLLVIGHRLAPPGNVGAIFWWRVGVVGISVVFLVLTILYFRLSLCVEWLSKIPLIRKHLAYIRLLGGFNATILLRILSLSACRYLVFVAQYYLLFSVFRVEVDGWQTFWSVSVVFLVIAIVPSVALLTELGVRWEASIGVVRLYSANTAGILATSLGIWLINLVIPALIGSLLTAGLRIFRK